MNLLVFGDSIAAGCWDLQGGWVNRLQKDANSISVKSGFFQYDMIYNLSLSGDTSGSLLQRLTDDLISRLRLIGTEIAVIFSVGANDSVYSHSQNSFWTSEEQFKQNYDLIINTTRKYSQDIFVLGLTPADNSKVDPVPWVPDCSYKNEYIKRFDRVIKEISEKKQVVFIPLFEIFIKKGHRELLEDGIHPNTAGHKLIYETVRPVLTSKGIL